MRAKPGIVNVTALKLGWTWTPSRVHRPQLNQEIELAYAAQRTPWSDARLVARMLVELLRSRGNVKARGRPAGGPAR